MDEGATLNMELTDATGVVRALNRYDEYGVPQSGNTSLFQYTGQAWLPEIGVYYYKNRIYSPTLGRFLQTDPIGYADGLNWYAYVHNDPVNFVDPLGLCTSATIGWYAPGSVDSGGITCPPVPLGSFGGFGSGGGGGGGGGSSGPGLTSLFERAQDMIKQLAGLGNLNASSQAGSCQPISIWPKSWGYGAGAHALAGTPFAGAAGSASATRMHFLGGSPATTFTGGGTVYALDQGTRGMALGLAGGVGGSVAFSNASSQQQLAGPFHNVDITVPMLVDVQFSWGGPIWNVNIAPTIPPMLPALGGGGAYYDTYTAVQSGGCRP